VVATVVGERSYRLWPRRSLRKRHICLSPRSLVPLVCEAVPDPAFLDKLTNAADLHSINRSRLLSSWTLQAESRV